jgi:hypothetical protein
MVELMTKTRYLMGMQCPKYLWTVFHRPDLVEKPNITAKHAFEEGHIVEDLALKLFRRGVQVPRNSFSSSLEEISEFLRWRVTLFQPGIKVGDVYARADILCPSGKDEWDIVEVKSSPTVKPVYVEDVAFQKHCYQEFGLKIRKCYLIYVNNNYIRKGEIEPAKFFRLENITVDVEKVGREVPQRSKELQETIALQNCPDVSIGRHCREPYPCPVRGCWDFLPEDNVFELHSGMQKAQILFKLGIVSIKDIPAHFRLSNNQQVQRWCALHGQTWIKWDAIRTFLKTLRYPLYYLDFEAFSPALPLFDGTRPYQRIPFQFSVRVVWKRGAAPEHLTFLANGQHDPRQELISRLRAALGAKGSVLVYNRSFEEGILHEMARDFPEYEEWALDVCGRMVDLMMPFRNFYYYNPLQKGSTSFKKVLLALTGRGYEEMGITDGEAASTVYEQIAYGDVSREKRTEVRNELERYCGRNTEGMMLIVEALQGLVR